jgi:glycosyltransferase involved in cell wall biosynthesis
MPASPLISIISIVYNDLEGLKQTFKSVADQSFSNYEYLIIDGASTDGCADFLKENDSKIDYWISEKDKGIADAFNKGIQKAKGDWILFLNAGDTLISPTILEEISPVLKRSHLLNLVYGKINVVNDEGKVLRTFGRAFNEKSFKREMTIPHQAAFHNSKIFDEVGLYDLSYRFCMDYELLLRLKNIDFKFVNVFIANMLAGGVSQESPNEVYKEFNEVKRKHLKTSRFKLSMDRYENMMRYRLSKFKRAIFKSKR